MSAVFQRIWMDVAHEETTRANRAEAALDGYREELEAAEFDLKCCQRERAYNLARAHAAEFVLREVLDHLEYAPIDYSNGVEHYGLDEGRVRGGEIHDALVAKIKTVLNHPAIRLENA